ncbi:PepSY domain-containing protein [Halobacillus massiliensis]|uniref:PepSY domain-containing protein n=1 Tax=Halobacillus massiliensis TaxID=1926286 RepID=UPI0009E5846D|nr:PepSY domain-containing protein [Halobacillus massiliensis]
MKKPLLIGGIAGILALGGAYGASASMGNDSQPSKHSSVSEEEAENIATEEVAGEVIKFEKDEDGGGLVYEFDIKSVDGYKVEVEVDAETGEIMKTDRDDDDSQDLKESNAKPAIEREEAVSIAKKQAKGELKEVELDDGHYEMEFEDGNIEYEVKVNGQTGEVMEFEQDQDDD